MRFAPRVDRIGGQSVAAWDIHLIAAAAKERGEDVIILSIGDPDFPTPEPIVDAAVRALRSGDTHYVDIPGRHTLKQAVADDFSRRTGLSMAKNNVIILAGAQSGLFAASLCLFSSGDEVITFDPVYLTYEATIGISGAAMVKTPLPAANGFRLDAQALVAAVTPKTRGLFIATPNNPTGVMMTREELQIIADIAIRHDLWVIADEVYSALGFEREHVSIASLPGMAERTVTVSSVSKSHAMAGWRVGWAIGPRPLIHHMSNLSLAMLYGQPGFTQEGALAAIQAGEPMLDEMRAIYRRRRDLVCERLGRVQSLKCLKPEAGMFALVDVRGTGLSSAEFSQQLYEAERASVLDAAAFGTSAEGHVRLSFTVEDGELAEACDRIARFAEGLAG
jgi:aspartate/methionine/tyrosine aminotransferase